MSLKDYIIVYSVALFWACIWVLTAFIRLLINGPRKTFYRSEAKETPKELFNPSFGKHEYVNVNGVKLHYVISGSERSPLMLMVHGFPEMWYSWRHQITEFNKDYRVVALDMRGFGESDMPQSVAKYRMDLLIEDIKELILTLGYKSCVLVSHDWGGAVCWGFAAHYPDMVDRFIVMNIPPCPLWKKSIMSSVVQFLASGYLFFFQLPWLPEFLAGLNDGNMLDDVFLGKHMGVKSGRMTKDDVDLYKFYFKKPGALTSSINYYRANIGPVCYSHKLDYPMPILLIWGYLDKALTLKSLDLITKAIPKVKVEKVEASHWVQMDQPEKVNAAIRNFLESTNYVVS